MLGVNVLDTVTVAVLSPKNKILEFMCLPQSQNKNVNNMCIVGDPVRMISEQGVVKFWPELIVCRVDRLSPYHVTGSCVRTDPSCFYLVGGLFNLISDHCLISTQNHMDL